VTRITAHTHPGTRSTYSHAADIAVDLAALMGAPRQRFGISIMGCRWFGWVERGGRDREGEAGAPPRA